jgi:hypothetical protein
MRYDKPKSREEKKRTCRDRLRAHLLEARRRHRGNPAASVAAQIAALFAFIVGRMPLSPPIPAEYSAPPVSPAWAERKAKAERLGVPARYLHIVMQRGSVPYSVLFHHIKDGGVLRRDAMLVLRRRAPEASIDWLDYVELEGRWSDLIACCVWNKDEDNTDIKLLKSALAWTQAANAAAVPPGPADAGIALTPGGGEADPEGDPKPLKP